MRKTYQLNLEGKNRDRLLESSKNDIRKYIRRERRKDLPEGADYWDFDMRFGVDEASAVALPPAELIRSINALTAEGGDQFFVEILRKPGKRVPRAESDHAFGDGELDFEAGLSFRRLPLAAHRCGTRRSWRIVDRIALDERGVVPCGWQLDGSHEGCGCLDAGERR